MFKDTLILQPTTLFEQRLLEALLWQAGDDTGLSSQALLQATFKAYGFKPDALNYPSDPADLGRCLRLLRKMPWMARGLEVLAGHSNVWRLYREHWGLLQTTMEQEVGLDWEKADSAPKTYDLMKHLQRTARSIDARSMEEPPYPRGSWK